MTEPTAGRERPLFERYTNPDLVDLIGDYPLAWVCPLQAHPAASSLLPLLVETDATGEVRSLLGHMARANPSFQTLTADPRALVLITGPQAYVSPACVSDPQWAPTWNYAQIRFEATVRFEPQAVDEALAKLLAAMERREPTGWTPAAMGERYSRMTPAIIAFRAEITQTQARFKLGQDEKLERLREILTRHPDTALVRWMKRFNASRL